MSTKPAESLALMRLVNDYGSLCQMIGYATSGNERFSHREAAKLRLAEVRAQVSDLLAALQPFAAFACSPPGECQCHNCRARDVIAAATGQQKSEEA